MLETARFFHQFAALLSAGFSVSQSLASARTVCRPAIQRYLNAASLQVDAGTDLATALSTGPRWLDRWTIALLQAAAYSGALAETCQQLAIAYEREHQRQRLYRSVSCSVAVIGFSLVVLLTALLLKSTAFLLQPGIWLVGLLLAVAVWFSLRQSSSATMTGLLQQWGRAIPVLGAVLRTRSLITLAELALPLRCGVSILQALALIQPRIADPVLAHQVTIAARQIEAGQTLSQSLSGQLPPLALQMIRTGEETGNLDAMLLKLGTYYESDLERQLRQIQGMLRPLGILAAGVVVLLIGMQGIMSLLNALPKS